MSSCDGYAAAALDKVSGRRPVSTEMKFYRLAMISSPPTFGGARWLKRGFALPSIWTQCCSAISGPVGYK